MGQIVQNEKRQRAGASGACSLPSDGGNKSQLLPIRELLGGILVIALFAIMLALWHCLDHSLPAPDDSSYILAGFRYADLLRHPKFWQLHWWHDMLTVNRVYPPTVMLASGALRSILGAGAWINGLVEVIFSCLLAGTIYGTTRLLTGDSRAAVIAAIIINFYPQISCMFHGFALDAPLVSMISVGLFAMVWWRSKPSWSRTAVCGVTLGAACLTKQIAAAFLIAPGFYYFCQAIINDWRARSWRTSLQLSAIAVLTVAIGLPWLLTNMAAIKFLAQDNQAVMGKITLAQVFPSDLLFYTKSIPVIMSPLLFVVFAICLPAVRRVAHRALLPIALSAVVGVLSLCTLTWAFPSLRYVSPVLIAAAIYTGCGLSRVSSRKPLVIVVLATLALAGLQYLSFNFSPYFLSAPAVVRISEKLGVNLIESFGLTERDRRESRVLHSCPQPGQDWGVEWALQTIDRFENKKAVYLNIMPDFVQLNGNTFELAARMLASPVRPTTSRRWTVMGDVVTFSPEVALYYQWYLLKSGVQGNILRDDDSERSYKQLQEFVQHSGKFFLVDNHRLPDGSHLYLWRQR